MSWWQAVDETTLAVFWFFVPGTLLAWALGLRGAWRVLSAPALSVAVLAALPVLFGLLGAPWRPVTAAAGVAVLVGLVALLCRPLRRRTASVWPGFRATDAWAVAGVAVAAVAAFVAMRRGMGDPSFPPQTWDAVFHLNAVRHIVDTGDASSLDLGVVSNTVSGQGFYPGAWHSLVALTTTESVVVASNAASLVLVAVVWPVALVALARVVVPSWPWAGLAVPVAATAYVAFPERMVTWGTLWPNALSYALVPVAIALTAVALRPAAEGSPRSVVERAPAVLAAGAALVAVALAQPSGLLAYALLATPAVVACWVSSVRSYATRGRIALTAGLLVWFVAWAGAYRVLAASVRTYDRERTSAAVDAVVQAVGDGRLGSVGTGETWSWALAILTVVGAVALFVLREGRWAVFSFAVSLALFALAADTTLGARDLLRPWYADVVRLAGLVPIFGALLAGAGLVGGAVLVGRLVARRRSADAGRATAAVAVVLVALFVVGSGWLRVDERTREVAGGYAAPIYGNATNILTSAEELDMLERLAEELPDGARILGDPFTGSALAYAVGGVDVVYTHVRGSWEPDAAYLGRHFADIETDPAVCEALGRLGVRYLYIDPDLYFVGHAAHDLYRGLGSELPEGDFTLVDEGGSAAVYEIDECG